MKFIILLIALATSTISLFAQDLNMTNVQEKNKAEKIKKDRKVEFGFSPSISYVPSLPSFELSYSALTYDGYAVKPIDTITTLSTGNPYFGDQNDISSKLLYNVGLSLKYKINQRFYITAKPYYSIYKPKSAPSLFIDDQSTFANRPQWDTLIFIKNSNFIGLPISVGMNLNKKLSFELGGQYLLSLIKPPSNTINLTVQNSHYVSSSVNLNKFIPMSGFIGLNYKIANNFSMNFKCNYGVAFYVPNSASVSKAMNYFYQNQQRQYFLYLNPTAKASVSNYTISTGFSFTF
jgi:hypothetical protein